MKAANNLQDIYVLPKAGRTYAHPTDATVAREQYEEALRILE